MLWWREGSYFVGGAAVDGDQLIKSGFIGDLAFDYVSCASCYTQGLVEELLFTLLNRSRFAPNDGFDGGPGELSELGDLIDCAALGGAIDDLLIEMPWDAFASRDAARRHGRVIARNKIARQAKKVQKGELCQSAKSDRIKTAGSALKRPAWSPCF